MCFSRAYIVAEFKSDLYGPPRKELGHLGTKLNVVLLLNPSPSMIKHLLLAVALLTMGRCSAMPIPGLPTGKSVVEADQRLPDVRAGNELGGENYLFARRMRLSHHHYTHLDHHLGFAGHHHATTINSRDRLYRFGSIRRVRIRGHDHGLHGPGHGPGPGPGPGHGHGHGRSPGQGRTSRINRHSTHRETTYPEFSVHGI
ncbi:hypothetical protein L249_6193 [Ophiocordyceps polyrhachis-furcata BCC 54312]|uniref:Uncharacterized protein n=1 Tax=Ophiocordyceps polyrhachis-furcata BCC 54312 TaxID=1330021 RepID=A0A367LIF6_9HYPO|nr:hypothetical protein L249_6193 [Ophiocordyceps polyrhachis-furcata BCC 54312]